MLEVKILPDRSSKTKPPRGTESQLAERKARLEAELEATRQALKAKRLQKAALQKTAEKKERTRLLILGGIALAKGIEISTVAGKNPTTYWQNVFEKAQAGQNAKSEKQKAKLIEDQRLFKKFIDLAKAGAL